jgi:outer membrane protein TolC
MRVRHCRLAPGRPLSDAVRRASRPTLQAIVVAGLLTLAPGRLLAQPPAAATPPPLTLDAALNEARACNAELPVARLEVAKAEARVAQARGLREPAFSLDADLHSGAPEAYAASEGFFRLTGRMPLYDGGELRAGQQRSLAEGDALRAGARAAVRDVDRAVRIGFSRVLLAQDAIAFRQRGSERLERYLSVVEGRRAAGQGVGTDLLRTRQRLAAARADLASAQRTLSEARMELNDLLGRAPGAPLALAPLPPPQAPSEAAVRPWLQSPEVRRSQADVQAAGAGLHAAEATRKAHVSIQADAGAQPVLGAGVAPANNGTGWGAEVFLSVSLPLADGGVRRGRIAEAGAGLEQARQQAVAVERAARLAWTRASADLGSLYREIEQRSRTADLARDAYLEAESLYRGGQGAALDVLDAYDSWIRAQQDATDAVYAYRVAQADLARWGDR